MIEQADRMLSEAIRTAPADHRTLQAQLQQVWCRRRTLRDAAPWLDVLRLYDRLLQVRDDPIVRLNRAVVVAEVDGPEAALAEVSRLRSAALDDFLPYHAVRANLLRRTGRIGDASAAYAMALALDPPAAERRWLERRAAELRSS